MPSKILRQVANDSSRTVIRPKASHLTATGMQDRSCFTNKCFVFDNDLFRNRVELEARNTHDRQQNAVCWSKETLVKGLGYRGWIVYRALRKDN